MAEIRHYMSSGLRPHLYLWVADPRQVTFLCLSKEKSPKEMTPRSRRPLPALLGKIGARLTRRALNNAPRAQTRGSLLPIFPPMLGGGYGVLKTPPREGSRWVAPIPVGASRAPSEAGSRRETPDRARGAYFAPGELGERPAEARVRRSSRGSPVDFHAAERARRGSARPGCEQGTYAMLARRSDRVSFSLVPFSWTSKRKEPRVQGRSHPQLAFEIARKARDNIQNLDSRLRGNDSYVAGAEPPAISLSVPPAGRLDICADIRN